MFNPNLRIFHQENLSRENFVVIDLDIGDHRTTLIAGYFKYRAPTIVHVTILEDILAQIEGNYIVELDANAFSTR